MDFIGGKYEVHSGDTINSISLKTGVPSSLLRKWNRLFGNEVYASQVIWVVDPASKKMPTIFAPPSGNSNEITNVPPHTFVKVHHVPVSSLSSTAVNVNSSISGNKSMHGGMSRSIGDLNSNSSEYGLNRCGDVINCTEDEESEASMQHHSAVILGEIVIDDFYGRTKASQIARSKSSEPIEKVVGLDSTSLQGADLIPKSLSVLPVVGNKTSENNNAQIESSAYLFSDSERTSMAAPAGVIMTRRLESTGKLLNHDRAELIRKYLPLSIQDESLKLIYSVLEHGCDQTAFFSHTAGYQYTIMIIQASTGELFGGFNSIAWKQSSNYYGSGESFIFKIENDFSASRYCWTQTNSLFMWSDHCSIAMGGGGKGFAFVITDDFYSGSTNRSETYDNEPLVASNEFTIDNLEVWAFSKFVDHRKAAPTLRKR